jgi:hypothetical protein
MRRKTLITAVCILVLVALVLLPTFGVTGMLGLTQGGPWYHEENIYATYEFNTLKHPTGLLGLNVNVATGGSTYATRFRLYIADSGNHLIRYFDTHSGTLNNVAGISATAGYVNGSVSSSQFNMPTGLWGENMAYAVVNGCDHWTPIPGGHGQYCDQPHIDRYNAQKIYVNDSENFVMRRICAGDSVAATGDCIGQVGQVITSCGSNLEGYVDGPNASAKFEILTGVMKRSTGTYYMLDAGNHVIRSWNETDVYTYAGDGSVGLVNGYRTGAKFAAPTKMVEDTSGKLIVSDMGNHAIRVIDTGGYVTTLAGSGQAGYADGSGSQALFNLPTAVVFNPADGMTYVADSHNNCIRRIDSSGNVTTYAGSTEAGRVDGSLAQARFDGPVDLVINNGYMYVSDSRNNCIRRIDMANGQVSTYIS